MNEEISIAVILGTARQNSLTTRVAQFVYDVGNKIEGVNVTLVDIKDYSFPHDGNDENASDPAFTKAIVDADAFFIVAPEYNHGMPGSLKRALDSVRLKHYIHKPVVLAGVSNGMWGGIRMIENSITTLREYGLIISFADVQFPKAQEILSENGELLDEKFTERTERSYTELIWLTRAMKDAIQKYPNKYHEES